MIPTLGSRFAIKIWCHLAPAELNLNISYPVCCLFLIGPLRFVWTLGTITGVCLITVHSLQFEFSFQVVVAHEFLMMHLKLNLKDIDEEALLNILA